MVNKIILGCGNFGGIGSSSALLGKADEHHQAMQILSQALDLGISRFDTANTYGGGQSESILGDFFARQGSFVRQKIEFHTKVGNPHGISFGQGALTYREIIFHVENSLRRLKTDYLDLYLMHEPDPSTPIEESLKAFSFLLESGKICRFGISNVNFDFVKKAFGSMGESLQKKFSNVQNEFNFLKNDDRGQLIPFLKSKKISYSAFSPLAGGLLTGKYKFNQHFPHGSRLSLISAPYQNYLTAQGYSKISELMSKAQENKRSPSQEALHFILDSHDVDFVIIGPRKREHYEDLGFKFK